MSSTSWLGSIPNAPDRLLVGGGRRCLVVGRPPRGFGGLPPRRRCWRQPGFLLLAASFEKSGPRHGQSGVAWGMQASLRALFAPPPLGRRLGGARESSPAVPYPGHFQLTVEESGATLHLRLMGEFDRAAVGRVENALERVFQAPTTRRVVFDLRR